MLTVARLLSFDHPFACAQVGRTNLVLAAISTAPRLCPHVQTVWLSFGDS
jgi:hypothetical protein